MSKTKWILLVVLVLALIIAFKDAKDAKQKQLPRTEEEIAFQAEESAKILKLINGKVLSQTEQGTIWIGPNWHLLSFNQKQNVCSHVYRQVGNDGLSGMTVKDNMSGKKIGYYRSSGLTLY